MTQTPTYDDLRASAVRVICASCRKAYDMEKPEAICVLCRTKYAMHMLRLGLQGVEILRTGRVSLPMPEADRLWLMQVRRGEISMQEALTRAGELEREVKDLLETSHLPEHPDRPRIEAWMTGRYLEWWKCQAWKPAPSLTSGA